jgi:hypothetical protein
MFDNCKNSKQQGDMGLGQAIAWFSSNGYTVSLPLTDSQAYDLVVDDGTLKRVQVKTTGYKSPNNNYVVGLKTCGGNQSFHTTKLFNNELVELLFILTNAGEKYLIPTSELVPKSSIHLSSTYNKYRISG